MLSKSFIATDTRYKLELQINIGKLEMKILVPIFY